MLGLALVLCFVADRGVLTVAQDGSGDFQTVQAAVDAAPSTGAAIHIRPGIYREKLYVNKAHIQFRGTGTDASKVVLSFDDSAGTAGGTTKSASVTVSGDDFYAENLTIENTFSRTRALTQEGSQAVALKISGDRSVLRNVRFLGYQDTLYANGKPARQYFKDCYIEGNVDFIFGDARALFENCEIHSKAHAVVMITAQSKLHAEEQSGYVFDHCRLTAEPGAKAVYLGRPWRAFASVVFLNTEMGPWISPEGWHEWEHDGKPSLRTVFYAEYKSTGPGANPGRKQLSDAEAKRFEVTTFFDGWNPMEVR
jgi:pectin methylesterase-like acyl-CoA thioesterase